MMVSETPEPEPCTYVFNVWQLNRHGSRKIAGFAMIRPSTIDENQPCCERYSSFYVLGHRSYPSVPARSTGSDCMV